MTKTNTILSVIIAACMVLCFTFVFAACGKTDPQPEPAPVVTTYTVSFNANGGTGTMASDTEVKGNYNLPANTFTAPATKEFKCWLVGTQEKAIGTKIVVNADIEVKAVWQDIAPVTPVQLKVTYTQDPILVGQVVDQTKFTAKCVYSNGTEAVIPIADLRFYMENIEITDEIDQPIPAEGVFDITAKYGTLEAQFRVVVYKAYGDILEMSSTATTNTIQVNFANMRTQEDLDAIFDPSMENIGIRMGDSGLTLAYDMFGNVRGASIIDDGAWIRFRQPNFKTKTYAIQFTVDTKNMAEGTSVRFHGDEAVSWAGNFAELTKSNDLQTVRYEFAANNDNKIVVTVYVNGVQVGQATSTSTVEDFLGGTANRGEGICWAVYDFNSTPYVGGAVITSMQLIETVLE